MIPKGLQSQNLKQTFYIKHSKVGNKKAMNSYVLCIFERRNEDSMIDSKLQRNILCFQLCFLSNIDGR